MIRTQQYELDASAPLEAQFAQHPLPDAALVLVFGGRELLGGEDWHGRLRPHFPDARIVCCSTSGEIMGAEVQDERLSITALSFEHSQVMGVAQGIEQAADSLAVGQAAGRALAAEGLRHVLVFADGQHVNGSELLRGLYAALPPGVSVTGGLAGDGTRFSRTLVSLDGPAREGQLALIGFYGLSLQVGFASRGGWSSFGLDRLITRAEGHVLYELDGRSALELYKEYLGELAEGLPGTALLFPLAVRPPEGTQEALVRTILSVDEQAQSMTFAGDVPQGYYARLMKANYDRLVDGAQEAAIQAKAQLPQQAQAALLVSCVGRKLVLGERVEEEVEAVQDIIGTQATLMGFYSYGEICPFSEHGFSELHNQTMTITLFSEA